MSHQAGQLEALEPAEVAEVAVVGSVHAVGFDTAGSAVGVVGNVAVAVEVVDVDRIVVDERLERLDMGSPAGGETVETVPRTGVALSVGHWVSLDSRDCPSRLLVQRGHGLVLVDVAALVPMKLGPCCSDPAHSAHTAGLKAAAAAASLVAHRICSSEVHDVAVATGDAAAGEAAEEAVASTYRVVSVVWTFAAREALVVWEEEAAGLGWVALGVVRSQAGCGLGVAIQLAVEVPVAVPVGRAHDAVAAAVSIAQEAL